MNTAKAAIDRGVVSPMFPTWGAMATTEGPNLAYLTLRRAEPVDGENRYEVGVVGHGPGGAALADHVAGEAQTWDTHYRGRTVRFELGDRHLTSVSDAGTPEAGRFVIARPNHPITVIWE
ncbi:hypothetical protein AB0K00_22685 [Dactylosporangium sp. NPDC049525]|uniref:hypothetical protein n=1 Tax=Dactylosporangium sp. NPDC049525 TaxID=3154730 RepID=UPI00342B2465